MASRAAEAVVSIVATALLLAALRDLSDALSEPRVLRYGVYALAGFRELEGAARRRRPRSFSQLKAVRLAKSQEAEQTPLS